MKLDPTERCHRCGYDIRGIEDPTCPECGASVRYRTQEFLTGLVEETRGGGRRFCLTCQHVAEFSDEGVCPLCGGRVSRPAGDA